MQVQLAEAAAERLVLLVASAPGRGRRSPGSPSARHGFPGRSGCRAAWRDRRRRSPRRCTGVSLRTSIVWYPIGLSSLFAASLREKVTMSDTLIPACRGRRADAPARRRHHRRVVRGISRQAQCPNRAPSARLPDGIAAELTHDAGRHHRGAKRRDRRLRHGQADGGRSLSSAACRSCPRRAARASPAA